MVKVTILNETGHTELSLTATDALDQIIEHPTHWAFRPPQPLRVLSKVLLDGTLHSPGSGADTRQEDRLRWVRGAGMAQAAWLAAAAMPLAAAAHERTLLSPTCCC